jgi:HlyD family secretion protein
MKRILVLLVLVVVAGGAFGGWYLFARDNNKPRYRTVVADKGDLSATINATGTIEPEEVVDIGAQVAGMIKEFGRDPRDKTKFIDYRSAVDEGTVLAKIDESLYQAAVEKAKADLGQAEANVQRAKADLLAMQSKLTQTKRDWERVENLKGTKALSDFDIDTAQNAFETAKAAIPGGEAAVVQAEKAVETSKALLHQAEINLAYCTIKSPVKGVIVDRRVNVGQTVVSSLNAPSLFLLAKDLKRVQIWASVNEADIGNIHPGQIASFQVDAYPGQKFNGKVTQIRLNATMTQNVVTYTVVVSTENPVSSEFPDGKLLPYMTANVDFEVSRHTNVLLVPNAALRWQPTQPQQVAPEARADYIKSLRRSTVAPGEKPPTAEKERHDRGRVWVEDAGFVRPVKVRIGLSDGAMTEIVGGDLKEATAVVVGEVRQNGDSGGTSNPFTPQMFKPKSQ